MKSHVRNTWILYANNFVMNTMTCRRTGEMNSPTQAAGVVTSRETNGLENTLLTRR